MTGCSLIDVLPVILSHHYPSTSRNRAFHCFFGAFLLVQIDFVAKKNIHLIILRFSILYLRLDFCSLASSYHNHGAIRHFYFFQMLLILLLIVAQLPTVF